MPCVPSLLPIASIAAQLTVVIYIATKQPPPVTPAADATDQSRLAASAACSAAMRVHSCLCPAFQWSTYRCSRHGNGSDTCHPSTCRVHVCTPACISGAFGNIRPAVPQRTWHVLLQYAATLHCEWTQTKGVEVTVGKLVGVTSIPTPKTDTLLPTKHQRTGQDQQGCRSCTSTSRTPGHTCADAAHWWCRSRSSAACRLQYSRAKAAGVDGTQGCHGHWRLAARAT